MERKSKLSENGMSADIIVRESRLAKDRVRTFAIRGFNCQD